MRVSHKRMVILMTAYTALVASLHTVLWGCAGTSRIRAYERRPGGFESRPKDGEEQS